MDRMRVCAKIDLDAVCHNINLMKKSVTHDGYSSGIIAVIKADGYGHGALPLALFLENNENVNGFAVATVEEALELRKNNIKKPILILGYTFSHSYENIIANEIRATVFSYDTAKEFSDAAVKMGRTALIHIKIDTGMGRIGFPVNEESADIIKEISGLPGIKISGIFTHFAKADERDKSYTAFQLQNYNNMIKMLDDRNVDYGIKHASNSAAIMEYPAAHFDMVRAGITLYGLYPSDEVDNEYPIKPVLSLHSHIVHLKTVEKGTSISYGGTYIADETRKIATIPVGYADGYSRGLSGRGFVIIRGKRAPIVGRVCMDQFMVDVSDIEGVSLLDEVTLVGSMGDEKITLEELGSISGRFNYEFACNLGNRIPRLYYHDGKLVDTRELL